MKSFERKCKSVCKPRCATEGISVLSFFCFCLSLQFADRGRVLHSAMSSAPHSRPRTHSTVGALTLIHIPYIQVNTYIHKMKRSTTHSGSLTRLTYVKDKFKNGLVY